MTPREKYTNQILAALGEDLFRFVLCAGPDEVASSECDARTSALMDEFIKVLETEVDGVKDPDSMMQYLKFRLLELNGPAGESLALHLRGVTGGNIEVASHGNELERLIIRVAADCYPVLLLGPDDDFFPAHLARPNSQLSSTIFRHPAVKEFQSQVMNVGLGKIFSFDSQHSGPMTPMIFRSNGTGSGLQLWGLAEIVIVGAWRNHEPKNTEVHSFTEAVKGRFQLVEGVLAKKAATVRASMGLAGVLLPTPGPYEFSGGVTLRAATAEDRAKAGDLVAGQVSGTDSAGITVTAHYAGDVVAETWIPFAIKVSTKTELSDEPEPWPTELTSVNPLGDLSTKLRTALLLAAQREYRVQALLSWVTSDDPLSQFPTISFGDPKSAGGLIPALLTEAEVAEWQRWYELLNVEGAERLSIAVNRVVRAAAERRDPVDVLIDSVIAWENMFGSSQGETTFRVTGSMGILLESDPLRREGLVAELKRIYTLRSKSVHGNSVPKADEFALCNKALDYAIKTLKAILTERSELLLEKDGTARSAKVMLGAKF